MKIFISATQYNEIYSDSTGILITKKINEEVDYMIEKLKKLQAENAKLRHCVEFYADKSRSNSIFNPDYHNEEDCDFHEDTQFTHFGKRARQVLKELYESNT